MADLLSLLWAPFLMCLVLTGIHAYLGIHVLAREVVFVDIALAQIAALGATAAFLVGFGLDSGASYAFGLGATLVGALVLALTRTRERRVSQEAVIGVVYAVSSAAAILLVSHAPHGAEHLRGMLVGNILTVTGADVVAVGALYAAVGLLHYFCRRPFFLISTEPETAFERGWRVRWWDFLFYASFGLVVTSSVRIAGVLLVFSYLIVPALAAAALGGSTGRRLAVGWTFGGAVSVVGVAASAALDLPTGATVVCAFGVMLLLGWGIARVTGSRPSPCPSVGEPHEAGHPPLMRAWALVLLAVVGPLVGCDPPPPPPKTTTPAPAVTAHEDRRLLAITSFYPLYEFTRQVAGDGAEVVALVPPGIEPHDWEPAPHDVARVAKAHIFVYNGADFEPWAPRLLATVGAPGPLIIVASEGIELRDGASQRRLGKDPHVWLDPLLAQQQVEAIRTGLARVDPANAERYAANARAFSERLTALHEAYERGLAHCARRDIVVSHAAFTYPARRYRLAQVAVMGTIPEAEPSPADLARLVRVARERRVKYIFFETLVDRRLAETVARETGAKTLVLNPIEGLTRDEAAAGKGYVTLMEENLRNLRTGLECT